MLKRPQRRPLSVEEVLRAEQRLYSLTDNQKNVKSLAAAKRLAKGWSARDAAIVKAVENAVLTKLKRTT